MLACLVGAMTLTSALLGWIDPSQPAAYLPPSFETLLSSARLLVGENVRVEPDRWSEAEILAGPVAGAAAPFLAATADKSSSHFLVDLDGRVVRTRRWSRQQAAGMRPGTIEIQIARRRTDQPMSRAQWYAVRALITALHEAVASQQPALPVRVQQAWAEVYDLAPDAMLELGPISSN